MAIADFYMEKTVFLPLNTSTKPKPRIQEDIDPRAGPLLNASHASRAEAATAAEGFSWKVMCCCVGGGALMGILVSGGLPQGVVINAFVYRSILAAIGAVAGVIVGALISYPINPGDRR